MLKKKLDEQLASIVNRIEEGNRKIMEMLEKFDAERQRQIKDILEIQRQKGKDKILLWDLNAITDLIPGWRWPKEQVESTLNSKLSPSHLDIIDTSGGCGASFAIEIVSAQFEGKRLLERHRMVNTALEEEMKEIHALSIKKAMTLERWKQQQESEKSTSAV